MANKKTPITADPESWSPETQLVHGGVLRSQFGETSEALFLTQGFVYASAEQAEARFKNEDPGFQYSRFGNPTVAMFEERIRLLEGAEVARATATGMAAVTAGLLSFLKAGDHVVAARAMFGSCRYIVETLCPRFGIAATLIDGRDIEAWKAALRPNTKAFFFETPANPTLDLVDIEAVSTIARKAGVTTVVDNVFATPMLQRPLAHGADVVVYSATKHIDGQGRCLGGAVLCSNKFLTDHLQDFIRQTGPSLSPFNAWVMLKGLETLPLRVKAQSSSAAVIADQLAGTKGVSRVIYCGRDDHPQAALAKKQMTGGGQMIAFEVEGGKEAAFRLQNALKIIKISNNLGDAKSIITHPPTTTHYRIGPEARAELGITDGMLRLSVGLENEQDLLADLDQAVKAARGG
ncbi:MULTISPECIES: O-succinylhomoserine sulfhydrylase [Hyphomicrobium]|jgi:O-succinylhomoserine sulfhydrylase|uniref:O-succinylhomoserine sulfhydrylase n=1 Tax=Hyphomicrobium TaxID=81 RepID=UPI00036D58BC|nr:MULTISPECIES: O-succinylhomoserine sulfhydrylase [Hyphomicrobium]WBT38672.1 O-succinylhomoserine sulfhydrylase [Hyphomicrobium sp. DMF-1]